MGYRIACLYRMAHRYLDRELEPYGLGNGTYAFLMRLLHQDGINQNVLSNLVHTDKANTARAVRKLMRLGYVRRERSSDDRRAYALYVTDRARDIEDEIQAILKSWTVILTCSMDHTSQETARTLLGIMIKNASNYFENQHETER